MRVLTIRARISIWTAGLTSAALLTLSVSTVAYIYLEELEAIDAHLRGELLELSLELTEDEIESDEFEADEFEPWLVTGLFTLEGEIVGASPAFPLALVDSSHLSTSLRFHQGDEIKWRTLSKIQDEHILIVAHDLAEFRDIQRDLITAQLLFLPMVAALTAWLSWLVAGRALKPIRIASEVATLIGSGELSERLPITQIDDEIGQFTGVLNAMLARIEKSYNQARQFAGDASHELSTPLTIIKGEIDRTLELNHLPEATEHRLLSVAQEVDRMHQIIDQLLLLARFDAGQASHAYAPVNLSQILAELAEDIDLLSTPRNIHVEAKLTEGLFILGDPCHLRRLLLNLFTNAVKYNETDGKIAYRLSARAGHITFEIGNTGPSIPTGDRESIFDRFFQSDQSHAQQGSGLGLSLCREITHAHGGEISLRANQEFENRFVVELPEATKPAS